MKNYAVALLIILLSLISCQREKMAKLDRSVVQQGYFAATLTEAGELQALRSRVVIAPTYDWSYGRPKIVALEKEGTLVNAGDWIGQIDTTGVVRYRTQKEADLAIEQANSKKLFVQQETTLKQMEAALLSQEAALRQAAIDTLRTKFEAEADKEISRLRFDIAQISFNKANQNIKHTKLVQTEDLLIQRDKMRRINGHIEKANRTIGTYRLAAPINGMVVYKAHGRRHNRQKIKVGDEIRRGSPLISLPDLTQMKAQATVHETDIGKIALDQNVVVRLDAFPRELFPGTIINISKICRIKDKDSKVKVFDFEVLLKEVKPICRPGMTVNCEIVVAEYDDAFFVGNEYIAEGEDAYFITVSRGGKKVSVPVELGERNNDFIIIKGDLFAGEKLVHPEMEGNI
jgi:HlyD family secretion protein